MKLNECLTKTTAFFQQKKISSARLDAELLLAHALKMKRIELYLNYEKPISEDELSFCRQLILRRSKGEPVAYILEKKDFYNNTFYVNKNVLIPRPETEMLVDLAHEFSKLKENLALKILDIGCGSGCVGLSLLKIIPHASLIALDISAEAISVAKINSESMGLQSRVQWITGSFETTNLEPQSFDIIVANPPYIDFESKEIELHVHEFEPHIALYSAEKGLSHVRTWAKKAKTLIKQEGLVLFEIGYNQGNAAINIFNTEESFSCTEVIKDLSGLDRIIKAKI